MKGPRDRQRWGPWEFRKDNLTLVFMKRDQDKYEIDLEKIHDSAEMLDWIFQIHMKAWGDETVTHSLLDAFRDPFDPQANLCSGGLGKSIGPSEHFRALLK